MNAVEIEEAVSELASEPFDRVEFPYAFLAAFGNKDTTIKRLRSGQSNGSDIPGGVLQRNNIHLAACDQGTVGETLAVMRASSKTAAAKAKFILATDGQTLEAEDLISGEHIASEYPNFSEHFGFFLPLAGISTVKEIKNNPIDIKATGRLNKLYVELLKDNPDWAKAERRPDMNHFMARLIFCFFAEDTDIFNGRGLFTSTIAKMSEADGSNTHSVIEALFVAMNTPTKHEGKPDNRYRKAAKTPTWADTFPYVNGGLFSGATDTPLFSRIARSYLLRAGELDWRSISPDIFGSMIQAVADDEERGALGMHYTSVPNILKVLNPLFLDDLRSKLEEAGNSPQKLLNLRKRMAKIRVFDPACGSGNFLVIGYKEMRAIEAEINKRRDEKDRKSDIPLTNFRGIELRDFPAEIARLALIIAEYQCDVMYRGQKEALAEFLPLDAQNWIVCDNALRLDWTSLFPSSGSSVKLVSDDLLETPLNQAEINFENEGGETYICGNPPYKGNSKLSDCQKEDLKRLFDGRIEKWGLFDYVCGWFFKALDYVSRNDGNFAFVATNSVAQGQHVTGFWKPLFAKGLKFTFAVRSFKWSNLATNDAGVTVVCIGGGMTANDPVIYDGETKIVAANINAYLLPQPNYWVEGESRPLADISPMIKGNYYGLSEHLLFDNSARAEYLQAGLDRRYLRRFYGATEITNAKPRNCFWFEDAPDQETLRFEDVAERLASGLDVRSRSKDAVSNGMSKRPHQFREMRSAKEHLLAVPVVSSENREFLPVDLLNRDCVISNKCFALYDAPIWNFALVASRLHWVWIGTVCVRMRTDFSYSNTLGWNTFPVPTLTDQNKADLTACAENILLAREHYFPATIADIYDPDRMDEEFPLVRQAHERNDEVLERIYIGRRFKNDTERLEKLFDLYTKMTAGQPQTKKKGKSAA